MHARPKGRTAARKVEYGADQETGGGAGDRPAAAGSDGDTITVGQTRMSGRRECLSSSPDKIERQLTAVGEAGGK